MSTSADEIEEANDGAARRAHVEAHFRGTKMAATEGGGTPQTTDGETAQVVTLPGRGDKPPQTAAASG